MTGPAVPRRRARLDAVGARRLMIGGLILALLWGTAVWESVAGASGPVRSSRPRAVARHWVHPIRRLIPTTRFGW